jgi:hypothetical protein
VGPRVLDPVPQQHCTTFECLAALQRHRGDWGALFGLSLGGVEHAWRTFRAVHGGTDDQVEFVDESRAQERAIGTTAAFEQQALHAEFAIENV